MSAIALEQLGYLIEVNENGGSRLNGRRHIKFKDALDAILENMDVAPLESSRVDDWKKDVAKCIWARSTLIGSRWII